MSFAVSCPQEHVTMNVMNFSSSAAVIRDNAVGLPLAKRSGKLAIMVPAVAYGHRNPREASACDVSPCRFSITVIALQSIVAVVIGNIYHL